MGLFTDGFKRTLAYVLDRTAPAYAPPQARPVDPLHRDTNADTGVKNVRRYVAEDSPARTRPQSGPPAEQTPRPAMSYGHQALVDRRPADPYPTTSENVTNTSGDNPRLAPSLPYGVVSDSGRGDVAPTPISPDGWVKVGR